MAIELPRAQGCEWGRSAGSEGLGSELFAYAAGRIGAIDVELRPLRALRVVNADKMDELKRRTCAQGYEGCVRMEPTTAPIVATSIRVAPDFSAVAAAFEEPAWPDDAEAVVVTHPVVILIDSSTATLFDGPGRSQRVYDADGISILVR